jgi:subtilase family serine protease
MPASCQSVTGTVTGDPIVEGAWYAGGVVDEPNSVTELIETNNDFTGPLMGVGDGPDLIVTRIDAPASARPDSPIALDFEVCNQGTSMSSSSEIAIFLSADVVIEAGPPAGRGDDIWIASELMPILEPGRCAIGSAPAWIPTDASGELHLGAIVDEPGGITELIESNNAFVGPLLGVGHGPDLLLTRVVGPPSAQSSGPISIDVQVCNQGTMPSPDSLVWLYLSRDEQIDGAYFTPGEDPWIAELAVPPMQPGGCHDEVVDGTAVGMEEGEWYVGGIVDEGMHVVELIESNNAELGHRIGLGDGPDLIVTSIDVPPSAENGLGFPVSAEVCNQGTSPSSATAVTLYHSEDETITSYFGMPPTPDLQFASLPIGPLVPGQCRQAVGTGSTWVPMDGAYFVGANVDEEQSVAELIESNNTTMGPVMGVGLGPDLVVSVLDGPSTAEENTLFSLDVEVCNRGTMWSSMTSVTIYHSADETIDGVLGPDPPIDPYLGDLAVPDLAPGTCSTQIAELFSGPAGPGFLAAIADESGMVGELVESNNRRLGPALEFTAAP